MSRLIFFGVLCSLLNSSVLPSPINYEYDPPIPKSDSDIFVAILEPKVATNVSIEQFMYHFKHGLYASTFLSEIFLLGIGTHLFNNAEIAYPEKEERRIAVAVGNLWTTLATMRAINRITMKISNETSHHYLQAEKRSDICRFLFSELEEAIKAEPTLSKAYVEEKRKVERLTLLPPLNYVNINLTKFGTIEKTLKRKVWTDPKSFFLVAHARFSQHVETNFENATTDDYDNILLAHLLVEMAPKAEPKGKVQKAYEEAVTRAVSESSQLLAEKEYDQFDHILFASLNKAIKGYPKLNEVLTEMKKAHTTQQLKGVHATSLSELL